MIGNGFDLACGLKSKYNDFYGSCIKDTIGERFWLQQTKRSDGTFGFWEKLLLKYEIANQGNQDYRWCDTEEIIQITLKLIF